MNDKIFARLADLDEPSIHIWAVDVQSPDELTWQFEHVLSLDERERAARFRFSHLRRSFIIARGVLRFLLGGYLDAAPSDIEFRYSSKGKPILAFPARIDFNVSHSGTLALYAFTTGCELGVDVEQIRPLSDIHQIASRFFCAEEAAELISLPPDQREKAFFLCWTRKEAYVKAIGDGLSAPLDGFRVTLRPGEPARLLHLARNVNGASNWTVHDLTLGPEYAASIAYRAEPRCVKIRAVPHPAELLDFA